MHYHISHDISLNTTLSHFSWKYISALGNKPIRYYELNFHEQTNALLSYFMFLCIQ